MRIRNLLLVVFLVIFLVPVSFGCKTNDTAGLEERIKELEEKLEKERGEEAIQAQDEIKEKIPEETKEEVEVRKTEEKESTMAEDFTLLDLNNNEVSLSDYLGSIVILNFWGTWCPPCVEEIPHFIEVNNEYIEKNVKFICVSVGDDKSTLEQFVNENNINYLILIDGTIDRAENIYSVRAFPTTYFIDAEGNIIKKHLGGMTKNQLISNIDNILEE